MQDDDETQRELELASIVEAFGDARRAVSPPSVEDWVARHPGYASELSELLPGIVLMESVAGRASDAALEHGTSEALPERIGEYHVLDRLGRGGMGVVYLARQESLGREVALKVLPTNLDFDGGFLERFRREAQVAAQLTHPNIVPVYGVGFADGRHYFVMRFVNGFSLDAVLREMKFAGDARDDDSSSTRPAARADASGSKGAAIFELSGVVRAMREARRRSDSIVDSPSEAGSAVPPRITVRTAVSLALQVVEALEYAHAAGVLHRDIKPGNILLDGDGNAWVTDFGLCQIEGAGSLTSEGAVLGTLRYMAPEQVEGASDERSDVYSLGLVLYELLTLRPAFDSTRRARLIHDVLHSSPQRVRRLRPEIPRVVETIVQKATAKLPEERYAGAGALARDLRAYLEDRPILARPPSALYLARLFVSRHKLAAAVALVAVLLLGSLAALYVRDLRASRLESERRAYAGDLVGAEAALRDGAIERAKRHLAAAPVRLRAWEWSHLAARVDQAVSVVQTSASSLEQISVDPSGEVIAVGSTDGLLLVRVSDASVIADLRIGQPRGIAWNEDGTELACVRRDGVVQIFARTGLARLEGTVEIESVRDANVVALLGPLVVIGTHDGEIWVRDRSRDSLRLAGALSGRVHALNRVMAVAPHSESQHGHARWWAATTRGSLATGSRRIERQVELDLAGEGLEDAAMRPGAADGVVVTKSGSLFAVSFDEPVPRRLYSTGTELRAVALDGETAILVGQDKLVHFVDVPSRRLVRELSGSPHQLHDVAMAQGADAIVTSGRDGALRFWPRAVAGGGARLEGHVHDVNGVAFSPGGRLIATGGRDGQVIVWDARRYEPTHRLPDSEGGVGSVGFLDDGRTVVGVASSGTLYRWSLADSRLLAEVDLGDVVLYDADVDHARNRLFVATGAGVAVFDAELERVGEPWIGDLTVVSMRFDAASDALIGLTASGTVFAVDVGTGRELYRVDHGLGAQGLGLSLGPPVGPAAGHAVYASAEHDAVLFRVADGAMVSVITNRSPTGARGERLMGATFSPDGERVLATTRNGLLSVFSVTNSEHLIDLKGHVTWAMRVRRCDATGAVVSVSADETARVWNTLSSREWLSELSGEVRDDEAVRRTREELRRPEILESIWRELASTPGKIGRSSWRMVTLMNMRAPGDPLTAAVHGLAASRESLHLTSLAQLEFAARNLPLEDPRQPELRRTIRAHQRSRLVADITGFSSGPSVGSLLPKPAVQRTLLASLVYFPWLPAGRAVTAVTPWVSAGLALRKALLER